MADRRQVLRFGAVAALVQWPPSRCSRRPAMCGTAVGRRRWWAIGGAAGYRPEHALASYELAALVGADCTSRTWSPPRTGCWSAGTSRRSAAPPTSATHPEFADRKRAVLFDGVRVGGWFTHDITLAELKTLRGRADATVRRRNTLYTGLFEAPTLQPAPFAAHGLVAAQWVVRHKGFTTQGLHDAGHAA